MSVYGANAQPLIDDLQEASRLEGLATTDLANALRNGVTDKAILMQLTRAMEETHSKKMAVLAELQAFRLDK